MINCIVIDDDLVAIHVLKHYLTNTEGVNLVQVFTDPILACNYLQQNAKETDLIFLDIEMPQLTGIELMASVKNLPPVIIVSAKEQYALRAFDLRAFHYLQKPLSYAQFLKAMEHFFRNSLPACKPANYIFVKENGVMTRVMFDDVLYFEALGDYVKVHTKNKTFVVNSTMKSIEDKLRDNPMFLRIHRTFHINTQYLDSFDTDTAIVSNKALPIGQKYRPALQDRLMII